MNLNYFTTKSGLLKVGQIVVGIICFGLIIGSFNKLDVSIQGVDPKTDASIDVGIKNISISFTAWHLFFDITVIMSLVNSIVLIVSIVGLGLFIDWIDVIYNVIAVIFYGIASLGLLVHANPTGYNNLYENASVHGILMAAGIFGILNGLLYAASVFCRKPAMTT
ncbi:uncharacterized protein LOC129566090 [Sitodiplosis mosellana]|uniref:uncharacterized protein LOC129566090 n=1 Tax=Sitodiplosis mosellana TaxID=263140 RepID=UPI002445353B|nr:uncharacterized protein LOC129566090 [Sitodiplosis mosellana]